MERLVARSALAGDAVPGVADGVLDVLPGALPVAALVVPPQLRLRVRPRATAVLGAVGHLPAVAVARLVLGPARAARAVALLPIAPIARRHRIPIRAAERGVVAG